jgi:hypothetical protein
MEGAKTLEFNSTKEFIYSDLNNVIRNDDEKIISEFMEYDYTAIIDFTDENKSL